MLRARTLFLGWLVYGALQLALLGVPGAVVQPGISNRGARPQSESQSVSFGKRVIASEFTDRRAPTAPFVPSVHVCLDLPTLIGREAVVAPRDPAVTDDPRVLPPARAPPALV